MRSDGEETHAEILLAAQELFLTHGYHGASMRMIAQAANITPAAIYNHFSGKDALFTALLESVAPIEPLTACLESISGDNAETILAHMVADLLDIVSEHQVYVRLALIDAQERESAALSTLVPNLLPVFLSFYQCLMAADAADGQLRDLAPHLFVRGLVSLIAGYILTEQVVRSFGQNLFPSLNWAQGFTDLFLHGVLRPQA